MNQDLLNQWWQLVQRIAAECKPLIDQERELRKQVFAQFFPDPKEGTNTHVFENGWQLKATYPIDRKVDAVLLDQLRTLRLGDLSPAMLAELHIDTTQHQPTDLVAAALRLQVDDLVELKPALVVKAYRELTDEQRALFERCLDSKPGSLSLTIAEPSKKGKAGEKAAGFDVAATTPTTPGA